MQRDRLLSTYSGLLAISQRQTERLFPNLLRGRYAASVGARNAHLLQYAPLPALRLPCLARARYDLRTGSEIQFRAMDRILVKKYQTINKGGTRTSWTGANARPSFESRDLQHVRAM